jgi:hypothetical protein
MVKTRDPIIRIFSCYCHLRKKDAPSGMDFGLEDDSHIKKHMPKFYVQSISL